jgi:hypothetical protein
MTGTTWKFISIVAIAIIGLTFFVVIHIRLRGQKIDLRHVLVQNSTHLAALLGSAYLILVGLSLHSLSNFWWDVLTSFLVVTGFQMLLSAVGIRLELLGNNPAEVERAGQREVSEQQ